MNISERESFLKANSIIDSTETYQDMVSRVSELVLNSETVYRKKPEADIFQKKIKTSMYKGEFIPSTTILTNAGRRTDRPLSACAVPPTSLKEDYKTIKTMVDYYHQVGMGTGFNFDDSEDPIKIAMYLNDIAVEGLNSDLQERPVGNMGIITTNHPKITEFISLKNGEEKNKQWAFNISINVPADFMKAIDEKEPYHLKDGTQINPSELFETICETAWSCGDPGLMFLERFNKDNPAPQAGEYKSIAPCGEVAMTEGETCQFSYINVAKFLDPTNKKINYKKLEETIYDITRFLDDALDVSLEKYENETTINIMTKKRKIGIGICGLAKLFLKMKIVYGSEKSIEIARDLMSHITYHSKLASVELSKERGPFPLYFEEETLIGNSFVFDRFSKEKSRTVSQKMWKYLDIEITKHGIRNISTTALPPTGRSATVIDTSQSIEPYFMFDFNNKSLQGILKQQLLENNVSDKESRKIIARLKQGEEIKNIDSIPKDIQELYVTALDVDPKKEVDMVATLQKFTDESISKTVNLPENCSVGDIAQIYKYAFDSGLKGITVYRNNSKKFQPKRLTKD
jgi:ribonucleoside-diphosphate reductase alpha chain